MEKATLKRKPFFYDAQIKRILVQIMACFAGYQVRTGNQRDGKERYLDVPVIYGDMSRVSAYVMGPRGDQDNTVTYLPVMSLFMKSMNQSSNRRLSPQHREDYRYAEMARDPDGEIIPGVSGRHKTATRAMGVPYDIGVTLSLWASNMDQTYQILEQILTVFNPGIEIQLSNSPADWSFITWLNFDGNVNFEKAVPSGSDMDPLYVTSLDFSTTVFLSVPAKVQDTKYIYEVDLAIKDMDTGDFDTANTLDMLIIRADEDKINIVESLKWQ